MRQREGARRANAAAELGDGRDMNIEEREANDAAACFRKRRSRSDSTGEGPRIEAGCDGWTRLAAPRVTRSKRVTGIWRAEGRFPCMGQKSRHLRRSTDAGYGCLTTKKTPTRYVFDEVGHREVSIAGDLGQHRRSGSYIGQT